MIALARRFVEVPMSVSVPPSIPANESGMSSRDGETPVRSVRSPTTGIIRATTGVLLMKPAARPDRPTTEPSWRRWWRPEIAMRSSTSSWTAPTRRIPSLRTNIINTVTVASLANPEMPSAGDMVVQRPSRTNTTMTRRAVTSRGIG